MIDGTHKEQLHLLATLVRSLADKEITPSEAKILCVAAADLLTQIMPMAKRWYIRFGIHSARTALIEASVYFETLEKDNE